MAIIKIIKYLLDLYNRIWKVWVIPKGKKSAKIKSLLKDGKDSAVFTDITRQRALPEEASIHTANITAIKIALKEIHKKTRDG